MQCSLLISDKSVYSIIVELLQMGTFRVVTFRHFGYERVYAPLYKVAHTPFHIQGVFIHIQVWIAKAVLKHQGY